MDRSSEKVYKNNGNDHIIALIPSDAICVLDIGCGDGSNAKKLRAKGMTIDGITISENEKEQAQPFMRNVYLYNLENGLPMAEENLYDVVVCSHVLEHICYPEKLLQDIQRVLKENGSLIIALPNLMHYKSRLQLMGGNFNYQDTGIWDYTHFRWYTFSTAQKLLQRYQFEIEVATVTGDLPLNSLFRRILPEKIRQLLYSGLIKISSGFFGYQLLFLAKNKKDRAALSTEKVFS